MAQFLDYNPTNGVWTETDYSAHEDKLTVSRKQDVSGILEYTKANRNSGLNDTIKGDFHFSKYATIPNTIEVELLKKGIDMHNPHQTKELLKEINENYPYLKHTNLTHNV